MILHLEWFPPTGDEAEYDEYQCDDNSNLRVEDWIERLRKPEGLRALYARLMRLRGLQYPVLTANLMLDRSRLVTSVRTMRYLWAAEHFQRMHREGCARSHLIGFATTTLKEPADYASETIQRLVETDYLNELNGSAIGDYENYLIMGARSREEFHYLSLLKKVYADDYQRLIDACVKKKARFERKRGNG